METVDLNFRFNATGNAVPELRKAQGAVKRLDGQIQQSNARMRGFNNGITTMQAKTRKFAMGGVQQAGYQIGDYAVQVANGTSQMQAFGQQAPQFLQIFGPIGAIVGAGVAILAAVAVVFERSGKAAKEAAGGVEDFKDAVEKASGASSSAMRAIEAAANTNIENARQKFSDFDDDLKGYLQTMERLRKDQALTAVSLAAQSFFEEQDAIVALRNEYAGFVKERRAYAQSVADAQGDRQEILKGYQSEISALQAIADAQMNIGGQGLAATTLAQISELQKEMDAVRLNSIEPFMSSLSLPEDVIQNLLIYENAIKSAFEKGNLDGAVVVLGQMRRQIELLPEPIKQQVLPALLEMEGLARRAGVELSDGFTNAASGAEILRAKLTQVNRLMQRYASDNEVILDPRDPRYNRVAAIMAGLYDDTTAVGDVMEASGSRAVASISKISDAFSTKLTPEMKKIQSAANMIGSSMESAMMSVVDGTRSAKDAFKSMATDIIKELYRIFVVKQITGFISSFIADPAMFGGMGGTSPVNGSVRPIARSFAGGGYTGNGARAGGLDGKGGYMAMIHPRESVVDHTKGQSSGGVTVNQNITFGSGVSRAEVNAMIPKIVEATKAAVVDAKLRGGSYGRSFA